VKPEQREVAGGSGEEGGEIPFNVGNHGSGILVLQEERGKGAYEKRRTCLADRM